MRPLAELIDDRDPAWPVIVSWLAKATHSVEVLDADFGRRDAVLVALQVTTHSTMGAVAYETGGLMIDHSWLRLLGSGHTRMPRDIASWNRLDRPEQWFPRLEIISDQGEVQSTPGLLLIADDAAGGFFGINGGLFPTKPGTIIYFPPDDVDWFDTKLSYSQFIQWVFTGDLGKFYETSRWTGWQEECSQLAGDRAFSFMPPLWVKHSTIDDRSRRAIHVDEVLGFYLKMRSQLASARIGNDRF
jgi:hypothetical protein